jgi:hypothetical protein
MLRARSAIGSILVVLAFALVGAGCGGGDDSGSPLDPSAAADDSAAPDDAASADDAAADVSAAARSDTGSQGVPTGGGGPQLSQGAWEGTLHFEISGDVDVSKDLVGGGTTQGEFSILSFTADDGSASSQIAFTAGSNDEAAVFVGSADFTGGGEIGDGKACAITMSKNDETAAEGNFSCKGAKGVSAASIDDFTVDIEGTFKMARP